MSSLRVLCHDHPHRTIALATADSVLLFTHPTSANRVSKTTGLTSDRIHRCRVEFSSYSRANLSDYKFLGDGHGTLGLISLNDDLFVCVITASSRAATLRPGETVLRIDNVDFFCLNRGDYERIEDYQVGSRFATESEGGVSDVRDAITDHPFLALRKLLNDGSFYYSVNFNLTDRLQNRYNESDAFDVDKLDEDMLWNSYMIAPLLLFRSRLTVQEKTRLDSSRILTSVIRGFAGTVTIPASIPLSPQLRSNLPSTMTVVSRLSSRRAGTRFNSRGIDDDGHVANFVETETILWNPSGMTFSYAQVRGSVPIFWEQATSFLPGQQKIEVTRSFEATQQAFDKHFESLEFDYGAVHVINLLSETKVGEAELSSQFREHLQRSSGKRSNGKASSTEHELLRATEFDFHAETRGTMDFETSSLVRPLIQGSLDAFAFFLSNDALGSEMKGPTVILQQEGVFRTNCLDCLDRTNLVQTDISLIALESFLYQQGGTVVPDLQMRHSSLWADNGDALSRIYAGTGALKSSFTRHGKISLAGAFADVRKSATRLYVNNFADKARQNTIDILLGRLRNQEHVHLFDPINDAVTLELSKRVLEYSSQRKIHIWTGTFNLNGRSEGALSDLSPWLLSWERRIDDPTIVAVGFQEIVELSPQQIMSTDPTPRLVWEENVRKCLNVSAKHRDTSGYVLLRSGQLVGAALMIFVKEDALADIKNVEGSVKKTGLSGMAGNKGGCAIRLDYSNTSLCFVTAHLAAGFGNDDERNKDYATISQGLRFQKNRSISDHDSIIWFGDFNYRIGLSDQKVRDCVQKRQYDQLYENDQLNLQMSAGRTFQYYSEGSIGFAPTYKYTIGSSEYDNSEKARIPAWCDRILWKGAILRQLQYDTADLRISDHRPVWALFSCVINTVDEVVKDRLSLSLYEKYRHESDVVGEGFVDDPSEDDSSISGFAMPDYPPPSSDHYKWWLDRGAQVQSAIRPPKPGQIPNKHRNSNPFSAETESSWISQTLAIKPIQKEEQDMNSTLFACPGSNLSGYQPRRASGSRSRSSQLNVQGLPTASMKSVEHGDSQRERGAGRPPIPHKPASLSNKDKLSENSLVISRQLDSKFQRLLPDGNLGPEYASSFTTHFKPVTLPEHARASPHHLFKGNVESSSHIRMPSDNDNDKAPYGNKETAIDNLLDGDSSSEMSNWKPLLPHS